MSDADARQNGATRHNPWEKSNPTVPLPSPYPLSVPLSLPAELYETLNYVYLLHSLAVNPESVLPEGKSLLSVLLKPSSHDPSQISDLHQRVETIVHKAFWDEVLIIILS